MTTSILGTFENRPKIKTITDWLRDFARFAGKIFDSWDAAYRERASKELRDRYTVGYHHLLHKL